MIIKSTFKPLWYLRNPHLPTLAAKLFHPPLPQVTVETIGLADGDTRDIARGTATGTDTILILHGLEGSLRSAYAQRLINTLNQLNKPVVFMFFRGCNGKPNNKVRSYHSGETDDLRAVIDYLKSKGSKRIALVGYSLGGNVTLKYMGEQQTDESVVCATATSVPMLLNVCAERMDQGFSKIYQYDLMQRLIKKVQKKQNLLSAAGLPDKPESLKTFVEFDDTYTAPSHGFKNAQHYYQSCSCRQFLKGINKPTLMIHSKDDPFMTEAVLPDINELSEQVTLELSDHGGHVGFIGGGLLKPEFWLEQRIISFVQQQFI